VEQHLMRSEASHTFFEIKQKLHANVPKGAPQLFWGTFLRVFFRRLKSNIHPCLWSWIFNPCPH